MKSQTVVLGELLYEPESNTVRAPDGSALELRNKSREVLALLVQRTGQTVKKEEILDIIWPDVVVGEESIVQCIADIRRLMGTDAKNILQTVPREGYRLIAQQQPAVSTTREKLIKACLLVVGLVAVIAVLMWIKPENKDGPPIIAVLPLTDLSVGQTQSPLGDVLSEGIIADLARFPQLKVIAKNTSFQFRDGASVKAITEALDTDYLVGGSQQFDGEKLRVSYHVIETDSGTHVYSDSLEHPLDDVFVVQDKIVRRVVAASGARILDDLPRKRGPEYASAFVIHMDATRRMKGHFSKENFEKSFAQQSESVRTYPDAPWGHIGSALLLRSAALWEWLDEPRESILDRAERHAENAISLDRHNYLTHYARARVHSERGEMEESIKRFEQAISLNPSDSTVLIGSSIPLLYLGRNERALEVLAQAKDIDPLHGDWLYWNQGWAYWQTKECDKGVSAMRSMANPSVTSQRMLAGLYACVSDKENAKKALQVWLDKRPEYTMEDEIRAHESGKWRAPGAIDRWLEDMRFAGMPET